MATEAEAHIGEANSINVVKYVGNIKVEDLGGLNATNAKEALVDDVKNEETEVKSSELPIPNVDLPENSNLEPESATLVPDTEADGKEDKDQVGKGNTVELRNGFADSTLATEQELKSKETNESIFPEAAVEEMICTEEPSSVEESENIPEFVSNEAATSDATAQEVKTTNTNNIEESTTLESFQDIPESAAEEEPCLLEGAVSEKESTDTLHADSGQAEEISENVPEPSPTETGKGTQVTDTNAMEQVQRNNPKSFVSTTEKKETLIAESSKTLVVTESVLETAVLETPVEVPEVSKENSVSIVTNVDTAVEASDVKSKVSGDAKKVEEKKENSLGKLFMQEYEVVVEEQKMTTSLVESSRDHVDDMGNEKIGNEAEETGENREVLKAEVKPSNQKSNNLFTKMKQSIVKAKKAIIGKSPSSKAMEVESRDDIKP